MTRFSDLFEEECLRQESTTKVASPFTETLQTLHDRVIYSELEGATLDADASDAYVLGVGVPKNIYELKRAFRRMALETHPDRPGGSHAGFLRTQALFEEALLELREPPPPPSAPSPSRVGVLRRASVGFAATYA